MSGILIYKACDQSSRNEWRAAEELRDQWAVEDQEIYQLRDQARGFQDSASRNSRSARQSRLVSQSECKA